MTGLVLSILGPITSRSKCRQQMPLDYHFTPKGCGQHHVAWPLMPGVKCLAPPVHTRGHHLPPSCHSREESTFCSRVKWGSPPSDNCPLSNRVIAASIFKPPIKSCVVNTKS